MRKIVFLDLEDTVLDDFSKGLSAKAVNHAQVRRFLEAEAADEVRIFSFAIADQRDVRRFEEHFQHWLETNLGAVIEGGEKVFTTQALHALCRQSGLFFESDTECMGFHGKALGFLQFIRLSDEFVDCEAVLVDDAIGEPMIVELPRRNVRIRIVHVDSLV